MSKIQKKYQALCVIPSDIWEHLPTLKKYAEESETIIEFGVRGVVSTWALLAGNPGSLISYDIYNCPVEGIKEIAKEEGIRFEFKIGNTLEIEIEPVDFLFIDTLHNYDQLKGELKLHGNKAKKYLGFHDTTSFEKHGESYDGKPKLGIWPAIEEFLAENPHWKIKERYRNNNGLTILERKPV